MNERPFQKRVEDMASRFGWKWWHVPSPMRHDRERGFVPASSAAGLPDLILTHDNPPRLVFMELKGDGGKLSDRQREFLQAVQGVAKTAVSLNGFGLDLIERRWEAPRAVGVYAVWPTDEPLVEQMLRTKELG